MNLLSLRFALASGVISIRHLMILEILGRNGSMSMGKLAADLGVSTTAITMAIDVLVRARLVERQHDLNDRRVVTAKLTEDGQQLLDRMCGATPEAAPGV